MATLGMAFSVLEHAEQFSAIGRWHAIADFWTAEEILEELKSVASVHGPFHNHFNPAPNLINREIYKERRSDAFSEWRAVMG